MRTLVCLLVLLSGALAGPTWQEEMAVRDSFRHLPPNMRFREMHRLGLIDRAPDVPEADSGGLRLVGKWGAGPSVKVTGRDSLVFLSRGSEVVAVNFADTANPGVLSHIQVNGLVSRSVLVGDRLYVGTTGSDPKYIDAFDVADPANPTLLGSVQTQLNDLAVQDTLVYAIGDDSFKVYNFADPENPWLVGACRDSGELVSVARGYAYLGDRWGLYVVDVRNPAAPQRVASWGTFIVSLQARDSICCVTQSDINGNLTFRVLDTRQPTSVVPLGLLSDHGGYDVYLDDSLAFLSGAATGSGYEFQVLSIADSLHPRLISEASTLGDNWGVWADRAAYRAFVADRNEGMQVFDITDLASPIRDTALLVASLSLDIVVRGDLAAIANSSAGMKLVSVADPSNPVELGSVDSIYDWPDCDAVEISDSFAYMGWQVPPYLRTILVTDPTHPEQVGSCAGMQNDAQDMVLQDSLLYLAGMRRFYVVNVARPREPVLVGSCVAGDLTRAGLVVQDTLAYFIGPFVGMQVFNVANPASPSLVNTVAAIRAAGCDVVDTLLYVGDYDDSLHIWSFADPVQPYQVSAVAAVRSGYGTAVLGRYAYVGSDARVRVFDVQDPGNPVEVGSCAMPYEIRRVEAFGGQVYVCCWDAGVAILDTFHTGLQEPGLNPARRAPEPRLLGSVVTDLLTVEFGPGHAGEATIVIYDATGREVHTLTARLPMLQRAVAVVVPMGDCSAGTYFVRVGTAAATWTLRAVKMQGR